MTERPIATNALPVGHRAAQQLDVAGVALDEVLASLESTAKGLTERQASERLAHYGPNEPAKKKRRGMLLQFVSKFYNPLIIVLMIDGGFSWYIGETLGAAIIIGMILVSVIISFVQEYRSGREVEELLAMVRTTATVLRNGRVKEVNLRELVPGDVISLSAGDIVPGDIRLITAKDLFINQSALTGESFPVEKFSEPTGVDARDANLAYMGTSVLSGTASAVIYATGARTRFGEIAHQLSNAHVDTSFDRGIKSFTWLMIRAMLVLVGVIFVINAIFKGSVIEALLFSLAVAVGLTPEMLPTIVAVNLAKGALVMAKKKVIVKRLNSIQNFGAMDILCTDKTGTLTLDRIVLVRHSDIAGKQDDDVLRLAYINSFYQTGLRNLLDRAVLKYEKLVVRDYKKVDEIPFDFSRKIMSVAVNFDHTHRLITKGAPEEIFKRCAKYELDGKIADIDQELVVKIRADVERLNADGFRVLAVAYRDHGLDKKIFSKDDERDLVLRGYIAFLDPAKPSAEKAVSALKKLGIQVKVLTGDNAIVTAKICRDVGIDTGTVIIGDQIDSLSDGDLTALAEKTSVFARLSPLQKERVIRMLQRGGHTVGYLGDGINDAPPLKTADIGISVNNGVDIAKESADLILLEKSLLVLRDGVMEGRRTFGNIVKYIRMGASSNFGNMISMTGASIFLPFLPMLPIQVLLNNFLYDLSQTAIPTDTVDPEYLTKPRPWDIGSIKTFMLIMGPVSSVFDFLTFGVLLYVFHAPIGLFHTAWFIESLMTQTLVIHVIRTARVPFLQSLSSSFLLGMSAVIVAIGLYLPHSPFAEALGFVPPPTRWILAIAGITAGYLVSAQFVKQWFIKKYGYT